MKKRNDITYNDLVSTLYYDWEHPLAENESLTRNITFQVTDDCCMNCSYCLTGDTQILMSDFTTKSIKDIRVGDKVMAFPEYSDTNNVRIFETTVTAIFHRKTSELSTIRVGKNTICITPNHKVLTDQFCGLDWKCAGDLSDGDTVFCYDDDMNLRPEKVNECNHFDYKQPCDVYNFETECHTYIANNVCVHNCYQGHKGHRVMSKEVARKGVDLLFDMYEKNDSPFINKKTKAIILDFIGGEPLMAIDVIDYICTYFVQKCLELDHPWLYTWRAAMTSNGALYFEPAVQDFLKKFRGNVSFSITLDGPKEIHDTCRVYHDGRGNFDDAYAAMKHFNSHYYEELGTKVTIAPENLHNLNKIVDFFLSEGMNLIHANCVYEVKWTYEHSKVLYDEMKIMADKLLDLNDETVVSLFDDKHFQPLLPEENSNWCGGDMKMLAFDPAGIAYPCLRYMPSSLGTDRAPIIVGSVDGIFVTEEQKHIKEYMDKITRRSQSTDECFNCPIAGGCSWCSAWNYQETGSVNKRSTNICAMHKARSLANVYYWNKWYKQNGIDKVFKMYLPKEEALKIIDEQEYDMLAELSKE